MFEEDKYTIPSISSAEDAVKSVVSDFVDANKGETVDLQRGRLPKIKNYIHECVDYLMSNLPAGVERVDGYIVKPFLKQVCNEKISELPPVEETEV